MTLKNYKGREDIKVRRNKSEREKVEKTKRGKISHREIKDENKEKGKII